MKCTKCDIELNDENYTYKSSKKNGRKICDSCLREKSKKYRIMNPEKSKQYYVENREKILVHTKEYYAKNREGRKDYYLRKDFGIGLDDLKKMLEEQDYKCKICKKEIKIVFDRKRKHMAVVDHDHATGKIRGILCHNCNLVLGNAGDNPQLLLNAAEYLGVPPVYLSSTGTLRTTTVSHFPTDWVPY